MISQFRGIRIDLLSYDFQMRVGGRVCETMGGHSVAQPSIILLHTPSKTDTTHYGSRDGFGVSGFLCYTSALLCQLKCIILLISEFKQAAQLVIQARNEILCSPRKKNLLRFSVSFDLLYLIQTFAPFDKMGDEVSQSWLILSISRQASKLANEEENE